MEQFLSDRIKRMQESQTIKITSKASLMAREGKPIVSLSAGEPDFPTPKVACDAAIDAINKGFTKYTVNSGTVELRQAIAKKLLRDNELTYTIDEIIASNGGKQAICNVVLALCNAGDEVIIPAPYWVSFPEMVSLADGKSIIIETTIKDNFKVTPEKLKKAITSKTKLLILNSPSNPTGAVYSQAEIEALMDVLKNTNIFLISDEMYEQLIYGSTKHYSPARIASMKDRVIVSNAVSKTFSMTGWRLGYIAGPKWIINACNKLQSQTTSNASSISQKAAEAALLADPSIVAEMRTEFEKRRNYMYEELNKINGIQAALPEGAFYIFPRIEDLFGKTFEGMTLRNSMDVGEFLLDKHYVATVPGEAFGAEGYLRLSYAASMKNLTEAIERMKKAFGTR